jgi:cytidine deaminase
MINVNDRQGVANALIDAARAAASLAYCPYSKFPIGAAVSAGGRVFSGCNIENDSYGLTICAERVAIFAAVAAGHQSIDTLALTCPEGKNLPPGYSMPCGACRQVIAQFAGPGFSALVDGVGEFTLEQLLPVRFVLKS